MSITSRKAALEIQLENIQKALKSIESSAAFKRETAIKTKLDKLMKQYGCSKRDIVTLLGGEMTKTTAKKPKPRISQRAKRKLKIYKNPETGEVVKTRGGNHRTLKAWKVQYKTSNIEDWLVDVKD